MPDTRPEDRTPRRWLVLIGAATAAMLALLTPRQIFDTNFYSLWEATNLLAGDHPYRDFFEWGVPLQMALSAGTQWLVGYRMAGEFVLLHWPFIIAGAVISFDLGYRLTRSVPITAMTSLMALAVLPDVPTFHYPKLFLYPATIWLAWRYMERPAISSAVSLGLLTAVAFLFRHDHGVYVGIASVLACLLARVAVPPRPWRRTLVDSGAYTVSAAVLLLPWLVLVQSGEGLPGYVRARAQLYGMWAGQGATLAILSTNPFQLTRGPVPPPPLPGVVSFRWQDGVTDGARAEFEQRYGLHPVDGPDSDRRWRYQVANVNAANLHGLRPLTDNAEGLDWGRLEALNSWWPTRDSARLWHAQITVVIPLLLLGSAALSLMRHRIRRTQPSPDTLRLLLAGTVLTLVDAKLFREVSYAHLVAPLTAAMAARFLTIPRPSSVPGWLRFALASVLAGTTAMTAITLLAPAQVFSIVNVRSVPGYIRRMLLSPPIDAFGTRADVDRAMAAHDRDAWLTGDVAGRGDILLRYVHDCTANRDRVLVTGSTPFQIGYLVERPVAGGHLFWHHQWRTDPEHEAQLLALLERQSVPFALSTHDPVLRDLAAYPRIRQYFEAHYAPLPGSGDRLLVDTRRKPTGTFGRYEFNCFH